jgi:hypothetical protein
MRPLIDGLGATFTSTGVHTRVEQPAADRMMPYKVSNPIITQRTSHFDAEFLFPVSVPRKGSCHITESPEFNPETEYDVDVAWQTMAGPLNVPRGRG